MRMIKRKRVADSAGNNKEDKMDKGSYRLLIGGIISFLFCGIVVCLLPLILTQCSLIGLNVDKPNEIGDTVGGTMSPFVGLIGVGLTFLAFWAQYAANKEQRKQFKKSLEQQKDALEEQTRQFTATIEQQEKINTQQLAQAKSALALQVQAANDTIEASENQLEIARRQTRESKAAYDLQDKRTRQQQFENKYYQMLSIHRDNINAVDIGRKGSRVTGRRAFLLLFNELQFIYWTTFNFYGSLNEGEYTVSKNELFQISYLTYFFGFGDISTPMVLDLVGSRLVDFVSLLHKEFEKIVETDFYSVPTPMGAFQYANEYNLGTGHLRRLSHYIRHLYQTVKLVDEQDEELLTYEAKYSYISNLRAQLSVHEQLLLYYNARSVLGKPWLDIEKDKTESLIERYCIIKSIPLNAADFFEKPEDFFRSINAAGKPMFEWLEIKERMNGL